MVFCTPAAVGAVAGAGATGLGLNYNKETVDVTREAFFKGMQQSKRLFTAGKAEAAYQHAESIAQAAQQHAEAYALSKAQYFQTERIHSESSKLSRDQDVRTFEMTWRSEARESLRDELTNQFNRYNNIMLMDTVCLTALYYFLTVPLNHDNDGKHGKEEDRFFLAYCFFLGVSIMFFSISVLLCVMVNQRLHSHTASVLERKLFAGDEELQSMWRYQLEHGLPTDTGQMIHLFNRSVKQWMTEYIEPYGKAGINLMFVGVLLMFIVAGLLVTNLYYDDADAVLVFWAGKWGLV